MPFARPTIRQIHDSLIEGIHALLPAARALLPESITYKLCRAVALLDYVSHGLILAGLEQGFIATMTGARLSGRALQLGLARGTALRAAGNARLTTAATGQLSLGGTSLVRPDGTGLIVTTQTPVTVAGGAVTVAVRAQDAGRAGNTPAGTTLAPAVAGGTIAGGVVAAGGLTGGQDAEPDDDLRERLLARLRRPPQAGTARDYQDWTLAHSGVTRVWVRGAYPAPGSVTVYPVFDARFDASNPARIRPTADEQTAIRARLEDSRPITATVVVSPIVVLPLGITLRLTPDTPAGRTALLDAARAYVDRVGGPGGTINHAQLVSALSRAAGDAALTVLAPANDVVVSANSLYVVTSINWRSA